MRIVQSKFGDLWLKLAAFLSRSSRKFTGSTITRKLIVLRSDLQGTQAVDPLSHELVHADQMGKLGWLCMRWQFFCEDMKYGHQNAPLELDAFQRSSLFKDEARKLLGIVIK